MRLFDAHCHLQDPRFTPYRNLCLTQARASGVEGWILNSTRETDWDAVDSLAREIKGALPAFGLHPWWLSERSPQWAKNLFDRLSLNPSASIGETGLDRWMPNPNLADQTEVLKKHLEFAKTLHRPVTLHCLKAWPELKAVLKKHLPLPAGFLLHSYAAPPEMTPFWIQSNAYFSISPGLLHPKKEAKRLQFASLPLDRILLETDAPDMAPPIERALHKLSDSKGNSMNHPSNLRLCLSALAKDRQLTEEELAEILFENTRRFFQLQLPAPVPLI